MPTLAVCWELGCVQMWKRSRKGAFTHVHFSLYHGIRKRDNFLFTPTFIRLQLSEIHGWGLCSLARILRHERDWIPLNKYNTYSYKMNRQAQRHFDIDFSRIDHKAESAICRTNDLIWSILGSWNVWLYCRIDLLNTLCDYLETHWWTMCLRNIWLIAFMNSYATMGTGTLSTPGPLLIIIVFICYVNFIVIMCL